MASVFTKIISGELPGHLVWEDKDSVAFLTIAPVAPGHVLVVPRLEEDKWTDLPPGVWQSLHRTSLIIGKAIERAFDAPRVGMLIAGFEVPHTHIHLFPASDMSGFDLSTANPNISQEELHAHAEKIRDALVEIVNNDSSAS